LPVFKLLRNKEVTFLHVQPPVYCIFSCIWFKIFLAVLKIQFNNSFPWRQKIAVFPEITYFLVRWCKSSCIFCQKTFTFLWAVLCTWHVPCLQGGRYYVIRAGERLQFSYAPAPHAAENQNGISLWRGGKEGPRLYCCCCLLPGVPPKHT